MSLQSKSFSFFPETIFLPPATTLTIATVPGQQGIVLKWISGGSLQILGTTLAVGATAFGTTFASSQAYLLGTAEIISGDYGGNFNVIATGTTCVFSMLRSLDGFGSQNVV